MANVHIHVLRQTSTMGSMWLQLQTDGVVTQLMNIISTIVWLSVSNGICPTPIGYDCRDMIKNTQMMQWDITA